MPKKQRSDRLATPTHSYVHPSLASSTQASNAPHTPATSKSVNDYLQHLRRAQSRNNPVENLSGSRYATPDGRAKVAGPPPPPSWTIENVEDSKSDQAEDPWRSSNARRPQCLGKMPGSIVPEHSSLLHQVLKATAMNISWHTDFDREYLSLLPLEMRYQLFEYIGMYGPPEGLTLRSLKTVFADVNVAGTCGNDVSRLDLTGSIGRGLPLNHLLKAWTRRTSNLSEAVLLDSWEEATEEETLDISILSLKSSLCFPNLTHLSLSRPSKVVSWTDFLSLSRQLGSLTHLALDCWPRPQLPDVDDALKTMKPRDRDDEAACIMNTLSKNTPSLVWLSIARCQDWISDLWPSAHRPEKTAADPNGTVSAAQARYARSRNRARGAWFEGTSDLSRRTIDNKGTKGPDWSGAWKQVRYVNASQEWLPLGFTATELRWLVRIRTLGADFANHHFAFATPSREPEAYRIIAPSEEVRRNIDQMRARNEWLSRECKAAELASKVRRLRRLLGQGPCIFDHGWHKQEALDAGYDADCLAKVDL